MDLERDVIEDIAPAEADKLEQEARETLREAGLDDELEVIRRIEVARGLANAIKQGEMVLMGAPSARITSYNVCYTKLLRGQSIAVDGGSNRAINY